MKLFLTEDQIRQLLSAAREGNPRDSALVHLMASTGLRISDILALKRSQVLREDGFIVEVLQVRQKKTGKLVDVGLRTDAREALVDYLASRTDSKTFLFTSYGNYNKFQDKPLVARAARDIVKFYLEKLGFSKEQSRGSATHTLRRSVAKLIRQKTGSLEHAMEFLGHKSITSTISYIDRASYKAQAMEVVNNLEF